MDSRMKRLMKELSDAINGTLARSDVIGNKLAEIKDEGYDVYLVLEATAGSQVFYEQPLPDQLVHMPPKSRGPEWPVTAHDARFLKSLHIRIDDAA
jgi:hypothetical protein